MAWTAANTAELFFDWCYQAQKASLGWMGFISLLSNTASWKYLLCDVPHSPPEEHFTTAFLVKLEGLSALSVTNCCPRKPVTKSVTCYF